MPATDHRSELDMQQQVDLAHQQAIQYGQDLAALYREERKKRAALETAYQKLQTVLESMSEGFLVVSRDLNIVEINKTGAALFEVSPAGVIGKSVGDLLISTNPAVSDFLETLQTAPQQKQTIQAEIATPVPRILKIESAPLADGNAVLVLHNITWAQRVDSMREEFLHLAAHELRSPLSSLIGFTSLLSQTATQENLPETVTQILGNILKSAEKLRLTVNDLINFDLSHMASVNLQIVSIQEVTTAVVNLLNPLAADYDVSLHVNLPTTPMQVFGQRDMLITAMAHLIENGIVYNQAGGTLQIVGSMTPKACRLKFIDSGVGIAQTDIPHILTPFFQAEQHQTRQSVGMGLGLSIVHRVLQVHHGELKIESKLGQGSTFSISLPKASPQELDNPPTTWVRIQKNMVNYGPIAAGGGQEKQTQALIEQLQTQLEVTQSQNLAYAKDLAQLYLSQRADAADLARTKAQISHNDRLVLMGQLAAGVAHDLSNLIGPILGYSQIILRRKDSIDPKMANITERILKISRRANVLLRQMVTLSKGGAETFEVFDCHEIINDILQLLEVKLRHANIDVATEYNLENRQIHGSPIQFSQVILNLVVNAIDAMPLGGVLSIKTGTSRLDDDRPAALMQITDTGEGVEAENLSHIFDAFFTTKGTKSGTGLGLSVSKEIIQRHNGEISVSSIRHQGTTFTILLPLYQNNGFTDE